MSKPNALIIEDDPRLGAIYDTVLKQAGFETEIIQRGDEALQRLPHVSPALILLDVHLPYLSGADLLKYIRADERLAKTPVIVLTADLYVAQALEGQADHVLVKSLGVSQLRNLVTQVRIAYEADAQAAANEPDNSANTSSIGSADAT
jgi:DNA-binding response OmpR family regulator